MMARTLELTLRFMAFTSLAGAQSASTTVSQSMPPIATAGFNPANVSSSDACAWQLVVPFQSPG